MNDRQYHAIHLQETCGCGALSVIELFSDSLDASRQSSNLLLLIIFEVNLVHWPPVVSGKMRGLWRTPCSNCNFVKIFVNADFVGNFTKKLEKTISVNLTKNGKFSNKGKFLKFTQNSKKPVFCQICTCTNTQNTLIKEILNEQYLKMIICLNLSKSHHTKLSNSS